MSKYITTDLRTLTDAKPPIAPYTGLHPASAARARAALAAQDRAWWAMRVPIVRSGLLGSTNFLGDRGVNAGSVRTVGAGWIALGCAFDLRARVIWLPSGGKEGSGTPVQGSGVIRIRATYYDRTFGASQALVREVVPPVSQLPGGAEPSTAGASWSALGVTDVQPFGPSGVTAAERRIWSRPPVTAVVTIEEEDWPRPVDVCVYAVPAMHTYEVSDDADDEIVVHGAGQALPPMPARRLDEAATDTDIRAGSQHVLDVLRAQRYRMTVPLAHWSWWRPDIGSTTSSDYTGIEHSSTSWRTIGDSAVSTYSTSADALAAGLQASLYEDGEPVQINRDWATIVPVQVIVRGYVVSGTGGTVRVQTSPYSYVDVRITSTSSSWHRSVMARLDVGRTPEDLRALEVMLQADSASTIRVQDVVVQRHPGA